MTASDVFAPPTTSTSGTMWGGLNGWPMTQRSGRLAPVWMTAIGMPDELDARIAPGGVASSISAKSLTLNSGRSGAFSWTKSASASARLMLGVKVSRSREAPAVTSPALASSDQASSTYLRRFDSAFGAGADIRRACFLLRYLRDAARTRRAAFAVNSRFEVVWRDRRRWSLIEHACREAAVDLSEFVLETLRRDGGLVLSRGRHRSPAAS